jgi:hypothetical protein
MQVRFFTNRTPPLNGYEDFSFYNHTMVGAGTTPPEFNEDKYFGESALRFPGDDQYVYCSDSTATFNLGTVFTISAWVKINPYNTASDAGADQFDTFPMVVSYWEGTGPNYDGYSMGFSQAGKMVIRYGHGTTLVSEVGTSFVPSNGAYHHLVFMRNGENLYGFLDGTAEISATMDSTAVHGSISNPLTIGKAAETTRQYLLDGRVDELEILEGVNKYSLSGFTPPTAPSTPTANHLLLMHMNHETVEAMPWYVAKDSNYWQAGAGASWVSSGGGYWNNTDGGIHITAYSTLRANFRPQYVRLTGTLFIASAITLQNLAEDWNIASGTGVEGTQILENTFESNDSADDMVYFHLSNYQTITNIEFNARPYPPPI